MFFGLIYVFCSPYFDHDASCFTRIGRPCVETNSQEMCSLQYSSITRLLCKHDNGYIRTGQRLSKDWSMATQQLDCGYVFI